MAEITPPLRCVRLARALTGTVDREAAEELVATVPDLTPYELGHLHRHLEPASPPAHLGLRFALAERLPEARYTPDDGVAVLERLADASPGSDRLPPGRRVIRAAAVLQRCDDPTAPAVVDRALAVLAALRRIDADLASGSVTGSGSTRMPWS